MLHVLHVLEACEGGTSRYLVNLVREQRALGIQISFFYSSHRLDNALRETLDQLKKAGALTTDMRVPRYPTFRDITVVLKLLSFFRKSKPDIVHAHSSKAGGLVRLAKILHPALKAVYTPHGYFEMNQKKTLKNAFFIFLEKTLANVCEKIHSSKSEDDFSKNMLKTKTKSIIIALPIEMSQFENFPVKSISTQNVKIAWLGRFETQKAAEIIFPLVAKLLKRRRDFSFIVGGWGSLENLLREFMDPEVRDRFVNRGPIRDLRAFFSDIDVLLMSSRYEAGVPYVAVEALAFKKPLIINLAPGIKETADIPEILLEIYDLDSDTSLEAAIDRVVKRSSTFNFTTQLRSIEKTFGAKQQTLKIVNFYQEIIAKKETGSVY